MSLPCRARRLLAAGATAAAVAAQWLLVEAVLVVAERVLGGPVEMPAGRPRMTLDSRSSRR
jgi:hypothetical protein